MNILNIKNCALLTIIFSVSAIAQHSEQGDIHFTGYTPSILESAQQVKIKQSHEDYTVIDAEQYRQTVNNSRTQIQKILKGINNYPDQNARIAFITQQLWDIPYIFTGAMGEGDWQPTSVTYRPGAIHVKQDPLYRLDGLDCQTFVQIVMALLYSKNINEFDQNLLKISYGAAGNPQDEIIHYYNRNNFVDGDWNPINQQNGWLTDATLKSDLSPYAAVTYANITRQNWFLFQQKNLSSTVRVLSASDGSWMVKRFMTTYSALPYDNFDTEYVPTTYISKEKLAILQKNGAYEPNQDLLNLMPTPAVIEIVRDVKKWNIGGKNIKDVIGSELSVSHMGLLYRQDFHRGELIYRKIKCSYDEKHQKVCDVSPIICQKDECNELMMVHATDAHPNGYYWYKKTDGNYTCSAQAPPDNTNFTQCNRVEQQPLFDYLTDFQYGSYWYMNNPSILGIHIEKLS